MGRGTKKGHLGPQEAETLRSCSGVRRGAAPEPDAEARGDPRASGFPRAGRPARRGGAALGAGLLWVRPRPGAAPAPPPLAAASPLGALEV